MFGPTDSTTQNDFIGRRAGRPCRTCNWRRYLIAMIAAFVTAPTGLMAGGPTVWVASVEQLQAAVALPANAGRTIALLPGVYRLDPAGPNNGRLELQPDMELMGVQGNSDLVVIDAAGLPPSSFQQATPPTTTGALRMGRGHNALRWLTLRNSAGSAFVETDLAPTASDSQTSVTVERCVIEGNLRGIDLRLVGAASSGRTLTGIFINNVLRNNTAGMGQGLRVVFLQGVQGATLRATLSGNTLEQNSAGLLAASNGGAGNTIGIASSNNTFSRNGVGGVMVAGISTGGPADRNTIVFDSQDDTFAANIMATTQYATGVGLTVMGADSAAPDPGRTNGNTAIVNLRRPRFEGQTSGDLVLTGARGANGLVAGVYNSVVLDMRDPVQAPDIRPVDSVPPEPTNRVVIVQFQPS